MSASIPQLNWRQLVTFHAVAHQRSFSRAAEELFLSQPAVSAQIRALEAYYGVELFDRLGRRVFLTPAGKVLHVYAQRLITLAEEADQALEGLKGLKRGRLAVGASLLVGSYMLPALLGEFKRKHPHVEVALRIRYAPEVARLVEENLVDLGLVGSPMEHPSLVVEPILADELVVILPTHHRWAKRGSITPAEFCAEPAVFTEEGSSTRRVALQRLGLLGLEPRIALELGHTEAVKRAVEVGVGISIISKHAVETEVATGRLKAVQLRGVDLHRHINLIYHRDKIPSGLTSAFLSLLQEKWHCQLSLINRG